MLTPRDYYNRTQFVYNLFWSKRALHYGLWDRGTRTLGRAIENSNRLVGALLQPTPADTILDVGCGVGGSGLSLAKKYGCRVTGITVSERQLRQARHMARREGLGHLAEFQNVDFNRPLPYPDQSFAHAFAIESLCNTTDHRATLTELHRVLKPGGRLVILDGFLTRTDLNPRERKDYRTCLTGWAVPRLATREDFSKDLTAAGFANIIWEDRTVQVMPSSRRMTAGGYLLSPFTAALAALRVIPRSLHENTLTMMRQGHVLGRFAMYGVVTAVRRTDEQQYCYSSVSSVTDTSSTPSPS